jgi:DNA polymerase-3 subunit gamma/tau
MSCRARRPVTPPRYHRSVPEYQALYRKYRPQLFSEVVGQGHVTDTLAREVIDGKVAHAYLFAGPRGTGKTTTARILAKALNCPNRRPNGEPCNICDSCVGITEGMSMDVIELDAASHNKVEDVREIRANVGTVASVGGARRVYILDEAHMLSRAAANALLKTLEEPPEHAHFVLATTEPYKLPDTIRSRTQRFDFRPIGSEALVDHMASIADAEGMRSTAQGLALIARHATGSARDALGLLEQVAALGGGSVDPKGVTRALGLAGSDAFEQLVDAVASQDAATVLALIARLASEGADLRRFVADAVELFRGLFLAQYAPNLDEIVDEPREVVAEWRALAKRLPASEVLRCIDRLGEALVDLREGREERLVVELAMLEMSRPETAADVASLTSRLDRLEDRMRRTPVPSPPPPPPGGGEASPPQADSPTAATRPSRQPEPSMPPTRPDTGSRTPSAEASVAARAGRPGAVFDMAAVDEKWPAVVAAVRDEAGPRRFAMFREARPAGVEGSTLVLEVPAQMPFHLDALSEDDRINAILARVLSEALGGAVAVRYKAAEGMPEQPRSLPEEPRRAPDRDTLDLAGGGAIDPAALIVDLLGGEVVEEGQER